MSLVVELTKTLIERPSITPLDQGIQDLIAERLQGIGFEIHHLPKNRVKNLWATIGKEGPCFVFAGHTDVVPTGPRDQWHTPPFTPTCVGNKLYGRGAQDMKGNLSAMLTATQAYLEAHGPPKHGKIAFLLTSAEEGDEFMDGTPYVMETLAAKEQLFDACIVGEPSSHERVGDTLRVGRRGSLSATIKILGKQGHVAYHHLATNATHMSFAFLQALTTTQWDNGPPPFPPTSLQCTHLSAGTGAKNVIPGILEIGLNFRYSPASTEVFLREKVSALLHLHALDHEITWHPSGQPFITPEGKLTQITSQAIEKITGQIPARSTSGGTSDARFIAPYGIEVIELGCCNDTLHQINEAVDITELEELVKIYTEILLNYFSQG